MSQATDDILAEAAKVENNQGDKAEDAELIAKLNATVTLSMDKGDGATVPILAAVRDLLGARESKKLRELAACYAHLATVRLYCQEGASKGGKEEAAKLSRVLAAEEACLVALAREVKG